MEIKLAETAGFCWGVKLALDKVIEASEKNGHETVRTFGPLIHSPQVIEMLRERGIEVASDPEEIEDGTIVIRAHGVPPQVREEFAAKGLKIVDATCPHVVSSQKQVEKAVRDGYEMFIVGDRNHPEVVGLIGFAGGKAKIVSSVEEAESLTDLGERVCVVGQSTFSEAMFGEICRIFQARVKDVSIYGKSICNATSERQEEVVSLAGEVDALVIIGGRNSANTRRMAQLGRDMGVETFHIETAAELDEASLARFATLGVHAGASTPAWLINEVIERLEEIAARN